MKKILFALIFTASIAFAQQEENISFATTDNLTLYGTLTLPEGSGPFPVAVYVHGSGPNDRHETFTVTDDCLYPGLKDSTITLFKDLSDALAEKGIASLRYDKRTLTYQTQLDPKTITPSDFIEDIHSAVDYVKTRAEADTSQIILLGHSQGVNFIPVVAQERSDVYALLSLAGAAWDIDSIVARQYRDIYYMCYNDTASGDAAYSQILSDFQKIRNGTWDPNTPYLGAYPPFWLEWIT